jgi:hypothetical protein
MLFQIVKPKLLFVSALLFLLASPAFALDARVETIDGEVLSLSDFSMDGRRTFSVDQAGGIGRVDWKEITSFEIKQVGERYWVEVQLESGKKENYSIRGYSFFRGRSDYGPVSIPFEKVKKASLFKGGPEEKKKGDLPIKESGIVQLVDKILMKNGDIILGNILTDVVSIRTTYGAFYFKKEDIRRLSFGASGKGQKEGDALHSRYGDKLTGSISESQIRVTLLTRSSISILREHIKEVEFGVTPDLEQKLSQPEKPF